MAATYTLISSQVLGSSTATITFSSIPQTYTDLVFKGSIRSDSAGLLTNRPYIRWNGDTAANYSGTEIYGTGTTSSSYRRTSAVQQSISELGFDSAGNTSNTFTSFEMYIPNYTSTASKQMNTILVTEQNGTTSNGLELWANLYVGTSAISSFAIYQDAGTNYSIGSSFYLYGIKNA